MCEQLSVTIDNKKFKKTRLYKFYFKHCVVIPVKSGILINYRVGHNITWCRSITCLASDRPFPNIQTMFTRIAFGSE